MAKQKDENVEEEKDGLWKRYEELYNNMSEEEREGWQNYYNARIANSADTPDKAISDMSPEELQDRCAEFEQKMLR